jgi:UDP-glucose 4-epimerase
VGRVVAQQVDPAMMEPEGHGTVLLTGASGFVASNLVLHLARHGYRVVAYDLVPPSPSVRRFWGEVSEQIAVEIGSVTDGRRLEAIGELYGPQIIVHTAAVTAVEPVTEAASAAEIAEVNLMGVVKLLDVARKLHVRRLFYVSSAGVYGSSEPGVPVPETAPLQLGDLYAMTKEAGERFCIRYAELFDLDVVIGRLGQPYGPMERDRQIRSIMSPIYQLARTAITEGHVRVPLPDYTCDWTYTLDLAEAIRLLIASENLHHNVYNLSNGQTRSLSDVVGQLKLLIPGATFEWVGIDEAADIDTRSDPRRGPLEISRLLEDVSFRPVYDLAQGLGAALPWWNDSGCSGR